MLPEKDNANTAKVLLYLLFERNVSTLQDNIRIKYFNIINSKTTL